MKTLVIYASPIKEEQSISRKLTNEYIKKNNINIIETINLNEIKGLENPMSESNLSDKTFFSDGISDMILEKFSKVESIIVSTSMINFNVPALLKNMIDKIAIAGRTFKYKYDGNGESVGLLDHLSVKIIATQGAPKGWYPFGDHVKYLEGTFNFLGMKVEDSILLGGTKTKEFDIKQISELI